jgi:hypothetical protein
MPPPPPFRPETGWKKNLKGLSHEMDLASDDKLAWWFLA